MAEPSHPCYVLLPTGPDGSNRAQPEDLSRELSNLWVLETAQFAPFSSHDIRNRLRLARLVRVKPYRRYEPRTEGFARGGVNVYRKKPVGPDRSQNFDTVVLHRETVGLA